MPLEMRKSSQWWYGRYKAGGKLHCVNLRVRIEGERPDSVTQDGDKAFERSRGKALEKFEALVKQAQEKRQSEEYVQKLHEIRTGRRIDSIRLDKLADEWDKAGRKRSGSPRYVAQAHSLFNRFVRFVQKDYKDAENLADVTPVMAEAFMAGERARGVSGRTFNAGLVLLRSAFKVLAQKANIVRNPFAGILTVDEDTTHRKPFTQDELLAILKATEVDLFIRPVVVAGVCTAMRRGDCCLLRWADVDLKERFVRVKTAKTGETVEIPMFPILCQEIQMRGMPGGEYVFPEQAKMYLTNAQGITYRVKRVLEAAGFYDETDGGEFDEKSDVVEEQHPALLGDDLLARGEKALAEVPEGDLDRAKRERMLAVFNAYVGGVGLPAIALKMGLSKSTVSVYLHEMEERTGLSVLRASVTKRPARNLGEVSAARKNGLRRASVRDFHSFRVTWITLALAAGVPMELVTRVTGHKTVDVVLKHYFRPGREDFRHAIEGAMPKLLMEGATTYAADKGPGEILEEALRMLEGMSQRNWKSQRDEVAMIIRQAKDWVDTRVLRDLREVREVTPIEAG